ncbi:MAG: glycosyltransferase [Bacteroidota bacterium]
MIGAPPPCPTWRAAPSRPTPHPVAQGEPLTLCDLTQSYSEVGGGIRTYLHEKRRYLVEKTPHRHVLIVPGPRDETRIDGRTVTVTIRSPYVPGSTAYRLLLRNGAVREALAAHQPDVIETLDAYNLPWAALRHRRAHPWVAVLGGYRTDFPRAYVRALGHQAFSKVLPDRFARRLASRAERTADRYAGMLYRRMDAVYALSRPRADALEALGIPNVAVVPLGVDLDTFHPEASDEAMRTSWGVGPRTTPARSFAMVYAGRLDQEKRPDLLVEAFEQLPDTLHATLVLVGDGPMRESLERRAQALRTRGKRVHLSGYVRDRQTLAAVLASADLYVSAMAHETFGISILEAQACGLPVFGVRAGAMPDRVPSHLGRLATPDNATSLAEAIVDIAQEDLEPMRRAARAHVVDHFGWPATFTCILDLYDRALSARRRALQG